MSIELISRPALMVTGLLLEAKWHELPRAVPAAWNDLFSRQAELVHGCGPLGEYLEVSISQNSGIYRELVGVVAGANAIPPPGMVKLAIPANRYLRLVHEGPLVDITEGFGALYGHAAANALQATDLKLDIGYRPGLPPGRHELLVGLAPFAAPALAE